MLCICDYVNGSRWTVGFLLAHVSRFWCFFHERITCCSVLNFVNIGMLDILTCMVIVDKFD